MATLQALLLSFLFLILYLDSGVHGSCDLLANERKVDRCFRRKGMTAIQKYLLDLNRSRNTSVVDIKRHFDRLNECLEPYISGCSVEELKESNLIDPDWWSLYAFVNCNCSECQKQVTCFQEEIGSLFYQRCHYVYYNKDTGEERTRHQCSYIHRNIHCKMDLISSACGEPAREFAFALYKKYTSRPIRRHKCKIENDLNFQGFRYTETCPPTITSDVTKCFEELEGVHGRDILRFEVVFNLVANGNAHKINKSCRAHARFEKCWENIHKKCPEAADGVLDYYGDQRIYTKKMKFICSNLEEYSKHLQCYANGKFHNACHEEFKSVPFFTEMTTYKYFCDESGAPDTLRLRSSLEDYRDCLAEAVNKKCGQEASDNMGGLINQVYNDPYFLLMSKFSDRSHPYLDCEFHHPNEEDDQKYIRLDNGDDSHMNHTYRSVQWTDNTCAIAIPSVTEIAEVTPPSTSLAPRNTIEIHEEETNQIEPNYSQVSQYSSGQNYTQYGPRILLLMYLMTCLLKRR